MSFRKGFDIALPLPSLIGSVSNNYLDINKRDILLFFRGTGVRDLQYHTSLRKAATQLSLYNKKIIIELRYRSSGQFYGILPNKWNVSKYGYVGKSNFQINLVGMKNSIFVLAIRGHGLSSYRLLEALECGAIPVIICDNLILPYSSDGTTINWNEISFRFSESYMIEHPKELVKKLEKLVNEKMNLLLSMQHKGKQVYNKYLSTHHRHLDRGIEYIPIALNITFSNIMKAVHTLNFDRQALDP